MNTKKRPSHRGKREVEQSLRLRFIDEEFYWHGEVTRRRIAAACAVSEETAKVDLRSYRQWYARDLEQDPRDGVYRVPIEFEPRLGKPEPAAYLEQLRGGDPGVPADVVPDVERRAVDATILQSLVRAVRGRQEIEVFYRSPSATEARRLWILPHAFLHDGFRWSVRCYSYRDDRPGYWGEMVLDRIEEVTANTRPADEALRGADTAWIERVDVVLGCHPGLTREQRAAIEAQYAMTGGRKTVSVRRCLVAYFLKRYQLEEPATLKAPNQGPLVLLNRAAVLAAMPPAMRVPLDDGGPASAGGLMAALKRRLPALDEQAILERALKALLAEVGRDQG